MKKEYLLNCVIVCFTLFLSKDFFASELFYNLFVNHQFIVPIILTYIIHSDVNPSPFSIA